MKSSYFEYMLNRVQVLKKTFLPRAFSPTGNYKQTTYEKACAFKVLTHAEFEYYLEEISFAIAKNAYKKWTTRKLISKPLLALAVYYSGSYKAPPEMKSGNNSDENISERVRIAFSDYSFKVKSKNNGIKEKNILQLVLPVGIEIDQLDNDLLIALNNYGSSRGQIAHSTRAKQPLTPEEALASSTELITYISALDDILKSML